MRIMFIVFCFCRHGGLSLYHCIHNDANHNDSCFPSSENNNHNTNRTNDNITITFIYIYMYIVHTVALSLEYGPVSK